MLWLFAYGSLIFRPVTSFVERRRGSVTGYARRLWQGSTDHRGVPGAEGRVVTLIATEGVRCRGVLFGLADENREQLLAELDHRERGGYERRWVLANFDDDPDAPPVEALTYVAAPANPNYLGHATLDQIVAQVRRAAGPSGTNLHYVMELAQALRTLGVDEDHVLEVAAALEALDGDG